MGQMSRNVAMKDAQIMHRKEECARSMGQRSNYVAVKDVQIMHRVEECELGMGPKLKLGYAAVKDVPI
jgi:hypothetical protein